MSDTIFTPKKFEVINMYPDEPEYALRKRMNNIIKENNGVTTKHGLTPKEWSQLKEEIGNPTHNRYGEALMNEAS